MGFEDLSPIGLSAFDSLRAEDEPWLGHCFVPPPDFERIAGARSALVFGQAGAGKTSLFNALLADLTPPPDQTDPPAHLIIDWRPTPLELDVPASTAAKAYLGRVLNGCADMLLAHVARWPSEFTNAPGDVQGTLVWFINHYLGENINHHITKYAGRAGETGRDLLYSFLSREKCNEWLSDAEPAAVIAELIKALREIGIETVYVLVGPDNLGDQEQAERILSTFLSSLTLFENHHFVYKMILPTSLKQSLSSAGAVVRRRIRVHSLTWHVEDLVEIVVKRIAIAAGRPVSTLTEVCNDQKLTEWLERTGGDSPRGWLDYAAPLIAQYLRRQRPISTKEWKDVREKTPPPLIFSSQDGNVTVGWRCIDDLPETSLALLRYLHEHRDRACTRDELYHKAYRPTRYPTASSESEHESPTAYNSTLDTAISRLRQKIEPDPNAPIYIVTRRGRGYKLEHAW